MRKCSILAPKCYYYCIEDGNKNDVVKHKGPAKHLVNKEWFESQYANPSRKKEEKVEFNFRIDWKKLNIIKKEKSGLGLSWGPRGWQSMTERRYGWILIPLISKTCLA